MVPMADAWKTAERVCQALREGLADGLVAVALFGSHARGDAHPDSDLDVLVIADSLPDDLRQQRRMPYEMLPADLEMSVQLVVYSRERFLRNFPSFYLDLGLDAKVLLDTDGFLEERLARIREIIREANLARERLGKDWHWAWTDGRWRGRWEITWEGYRDL
jgi:hypothetical protein